MSLHDEAVVGAVNHGFTLDARWLVSLLVISKSRHGNAVVANKYWERAYGLYLTSGATSKAAQLVAKTGLPVRV